MASVLLCTEIFLITEDLRFIRSFESKLVLLQVWQVGMYGVVYISGTGLFETKKPSKMCFLQSEST